MSRNIRSRISKNLLVPLAQMISANEYEASFPRSIHISGDLITVHYVD